MNRLLNFIFILFCLTLPARSLFSQLLQPSRFQVQVRNNEEGFMVMNMENEGLMMVHDLGRYEKDLKEWEMVVLDSALNPAWSAKFSIENELGFIGYEYRPGYFFMLFTKSSPDSFRGSIVMINLLTRTYTIEKIDIQLALKISHYTVAGTNSIIGGSVGSQPAIAIYQHGTGKTRILPGFFLTDADLLDIKPNHNNTFSVLQLQKAGKDKTVVYRAYDQDGNLLIEDRFKVDPEVSLLSAMASTLKNEEVMIAGAYTYGTNRMASGFFTATVNPFDEQELTYTDFTMLRHFLDYMPQSKSSKVVEKANQRRLYGRAPEFRTAVNLHRLDDTPFGFVLFGESFVPPVQTTNNFMTASPYALRSLGYGYGNPYYWGFPSMRYYGYDPFLQQPSDRAENRMVSSFTVAFNHEGKRMWDQSVAFDELRTLSANQVSEYVATENGANFMYTYEDELRYSGRTSEDEPKLMNSMPIELPPGERLRNESNSFHTARWWFGRNIFVFGYQNLRDEKNPEDIHRKRVFFINKITLGL